MGVREDATARAIFELDQRLALLADVRELVERSQADFVQTVAEAVKQANAEVFGEAEADIRAEEAEILRDERRRRADKEASEG